MSRGLRKALGTPLDAQQNPEVGPRTPFLHSDCEPHRVAVAAQTTFSTSNCVAAQTTCGVSSHQDPSLLECARFTHSLALLCSLLQVCAPCSVCRSVPSAAAAANQDPKSEPHGLGSALPSSLPFC